MQQPTSVLLICGGTFHDFGFAAEQLQRGIGRIGSGHLDKVRDYAEIDQIEQYGALITYTNDVMPTEDQTLRLRQWLEQGGRWLALHGSNAHIDFDGNTGKVTALNDHPEFNQLIGSRFIAHPPAHRFEVRKTKSEHPLLNHIQNFELEDELYLCEFFGEPEVLMYANFSGNAQRGFTQWQWSEDDPKRPVLYIKRMGKGAVLYLTLGHCRGTTDMQPFMEECAQERYGWGKSEFELLLKECIRWVLSHGEYKNET